MNFSDEYEIEKFSKEELVLAIQTVGARRLQFDNLLWQIPMLSITGEAFLFIIILGDKTSHFSRTLSSFLGMMLPAASLLLYARHRASEVHDAHLLGALEERFFGHSFHGKSFEILGKIS